MGAPPPNPRFGGNRKLTKRDNPFLKINRSLHFIRFSFLLNLTHATAINRKPRVNSGLSPGFTSGLPWEAFLLATAL